MSFIDESNRQADEHIREYWETRERVLADAKKLVELAKSQGDDATVFENFVHNIEDNPPLFPRPDDL